MTKRILSVLLSLCMILCITPTMTVTGGAANSEVVVTVTSAAEFIKAINDSNTRTDETTVISIGKNFTVSLNENKRCFLIKTKVIIDLNYYGFSIKQEVDSDKVFYLMDGAELTIRDSTRFQSGVLKIIGNGKKAISAVRFSGNPNATLRLESGTVEGENLEYNREMVDGRVYGTPGGFVRLDEKTSNFIMTGGTIKNFYGVYGGAVSVEYGKFVMEGGTIQNCYARNGGAISVDYGKNAVLTMGGGSGTPVIKNNSALGPGGGLYVSAAKSKVEIKDVLFENNYSTGSEDLPVNIQHAAEIYVGSGCEVTMSGGTIKNTGTGMYTLYSSGKFNVTKDAIVDINSQHCTLTESGANNYYFDFDGGYAIIKGRYAAGDSFTVSDTNGLRFGSSESTLGEIQQILKNQDITYAQYIKIAKKRTVTFKLAVDEPTELSTQTVLQGDKIQKPANPPARNGYVFGNIWAIFLGDGYRHWDFDNDVLTEDTTLYGRWTGYRLTITFNSNGYSMSGSSEIRAEYGQKFKDLSGVPTINPASFMKFMGWYTASTDGTKVDENTVFTEDTTLYAKCAPQYQVFVYYIYKNDNGEDSTLQMLNHLDANGRVPKPYVKPAQKVGYTFDDWYLGGYDSDVSYGEMTENYTKLITVADLFREYGKLDGARANLYLYGKYTQRNDYTVKFESAGNVIQTKSNLKWTDKVLENVSVPTRNGYNFLGWKYGDTSVTADTTYADLAGADSTAEITLIAQWQDTEKPKGEISIGNSSWKTFLNNITFGLFFKNAQTVAITASDNSNASVEIEYLTAQKKLTESELAAATFSKYTKPFDINPDNKYIIYAKLTDEAGNTGYMCSDGIVIDSVAPVIQGIENGKTYCEAQTITVKDEYLNIVTVNGIPIALDENSQFVLSSADGEQNIVVTDKAGNQTECNVTVNNGHTFGQWLPNENGTHTRKCTIAECTTGIVTENCADADKDHRCDSCRTTLSEHEDANKDHICDYCNKEISTHSGGTATCKDRAICEICNEEYGDLAPHELTHITAKPATAAEFGNTEYWYCSVCDRYFSDENAENEIEPTDTVISKLAPKIIAGDGATITQGEKKALSFTSDAAFEDFLRVEVDGVTLDEANYTVKEGSTVITLNADYVATLAVGEHTLGIVSESGTATAKFTVNKKAEETTAETTTTPSNEAETEKAVKADNKTSPLTGGSSNLALWIALLFISGGAVIGTTVVSRKKKQERK